MKKKIYFIAVILIANLFASNAQLKVLGSPYTGSVSVGYTGYSNIWLGSQPSSVAVNGFDSGKWGIEIWGENLNIWKPYPSQNNGEVNYYMFLTPSGAVGVGKVPTHSEICLDVKGHVYANNYQLTSDERLKKDIKPLKEQINKIYFLNGKSYKKFDQQEEVSLPDIVDNNGNIIKKFVKKDAKNNKMDSGVEEFGFLSQELMDVYPELVSKDTLGFYYVNYIGLIPVLVETLKDQKSQIDEQNTQIEELKVLVGKLVNSKK